MKIYKLMMTATLAAMLGFGLQACTSNGDGNDNGGGGGGGDGGITTGGVSGGATGGTTSGDPGLPNDGSTPTHITDGGTPVTGNFICTKGSAGYGNVKTVVGTGGLVGGPLSTVLDQLGATTVTALLNSISEPDNVIDGNLDTYASVSFTAGLLASAIDTIDESVVLPSGETVPAGNFAVFGITFPSGLANVTLLNSIAVTTFDNGNKQESNTLDQNALTLLKAVGGSSPIAAYIGLKTTKPYDTAQISLTPGLITANVGDVVHIHELCTDGDLVTPKTP